MCGISGSYVLGVFAADPLVVEGIDVTSNAADLSGRGKSISLASVIHVSHWLIRPRPRSEMVWSGLFLTSGVVLVNTRRTGSAGFP